MLFSSSFILTFIYRYVSLALRSVFSRDNANVVCFLELTSLCHICQNYECSLNGGQFKIMFSGFLRCAHSDSELTVGVSLPERALEMVTLPSGWNELNKYELMILVGNAIVVYALYILFGGNICFRLV